MASRYTLIKQTMEHISVFLTPRMKHLGERRQLSLFAARPEKGTNEWQLFAGVREYHIDAYPSGAAKKSTSKIGAWSRSLKGIKYRKLSTIPRM